MSPPGEDAADGLNRGVELQDSSTIDDGQWEDYTCQGSWEDFIRSLEGVLRDWKSCNTDLVVAGKHPSSTSPSPPASFSRCLEHDGQLFSIQLVPNPELAAVPVPTAATTAAATATTATTTTTTATTTAATATATTTTAAAKSRTASAACQLENRRLDFASDGETLTRLHRWFGLTQFVLLRALGKSGSPGMTLDQLLWATTVAAGNCKCSVPMLVSCDWNGLDCERSDGGAEGSDGGDGSAGGGEMRSGAGCKGYSAPGSEGVACSVLFQTQWTAKPPPECLYLDGLTDLFLSKIRDAHCLPGRAFAPRVYASVQQSWEWTKPETEPPIPPPGLPWDRAHGVKELSGSAVTAEQDGGNVGGRSPVAGGEIRTTVTAPLAESSVIATVGRVGPLGEKRKEAVRRLLGASQGGKERSRLWGPDEDPLLSISLRVRWTDLREGLVEESQHYTTLNPLPGGGEAVFGSDGGDGGSVGQWFVTPRWKVNATDANGAKRRRAEGCLGDACCRLLAALVLTTTMHPGTLIADLGADPMSDSPMAVAKDYGKAASAMLSADTRASVEELCSKTHPPSIDHNEIDAILRHLLQSEEEQEEAGGEGLPAPTAPLSDTPAALSGGAAGAAAAYQSGQCGASAGLSAGGLEKQGQTSKWTQVYPREQGGRGSVAAEEGARQSSEGGLFPVPRSPYDGASEAWHPEARSTSVPSREEEEAEERDKSLWAWAERGGAPIGRLVSLLSLRIANCDDLGSMSLLWMSFVRDVRLLWEDGAVIPRMRAMPEVDGISMFDRRVSCTGQNLSVAAQLRGREARDCAPRRDGLRSSEGVRQWRGCGMSDGWRFSAEEGRLLPDTRMCLIWQKLQMLNCCRPDGGKVAVASAFTAAFALSAAEPYSPQPSLGAAGWGGDEDEEDSLFFDTREYCQTSEDENGGGGSDRDRDGDRNRDRGGDGCCGDDDPRRRSSDCGGDGSGVDDNGACAGVVSDDDLRRGEEGPTGLSSSAAPSDLPASPPVEGDGLPTVAAADIGGHNAVTVSSDVGDSSVTDRHGGDDSDAGDARQGEQCSVAVAPEAAEVSAEVAVGAAGAAEAVEPAEPEAAGVAKAAGAAEAAESAGPAEAAGVAEAEGAAKASYKADEDESPELPTPAGTRATAQQTLDAAATSAAPAGEMEAHDHHHQNPTDSARDDSEKLAEAESLERLEGLTGGRPHQDGDTAGSPLPARREGPTPATAPASASPVAAARRLAARGPPRLLRTGGAVRAVRLPSSGPVTGDMLEQQTGQAGVYRWREVLVADMEAFRRENGSAAAFADFVRWYRPECWQGAMPDGEWVQASDDRVGGAAEDDRRLAWPGQGQVLWRAPEPEARSSPSPGVTRPSRPPSSALTLATWLSCWAETGTAKEKERAPSPLFCRVKEGEKALHYLETISPGPLLVQLLSALLGLSVFILEESCAPIDGLSAAKHAMDKARRKVAEAVELLASAAEGDGSNDEAAATSTARGGDGAQRRATPQEAGSRPWSPFRSALIAADDACVAVKEAETALARTVSLLRSMPGQRELVDAAVGSCDETGETPVVTRSQKEFLRDLLLAQGIHKTPGSELEDLLARYDEEHQRESGSGGEGEEHQRESGRGGDGGSGGGGGMMPPPITREYVLRCQTPAPFFSRNVGRGQIGAYPTPSSRMFAKTNGRHLRVALSLCESEI